MLRPTTEEILLSISRDFDENIRPDPQSPLAISLSLTASNLLRHVRLRVQREEGLIQKDLDELRIILSGVRDFMTGRLHGGLVGRGSAIAAALDAPQSASLPPARGAWEQWEALRWLLANALDELIEARTHYRDDPTYRTVRTNIRAYLDRSLTREAELITEAFTLARR